MCTWDEYFYDICNVIAKRSRCMSRQIGAILVKDNCVISQGYNGPPRKVPHCDKRIRWDKALQKAFKEKRIPLKDKLEQCPRRLLGLASSEGLELCPAVHAEANCINQAARNGICTKNATMYMTCSIPCKACLGHIINAGIIDIVCASFDYYDDASRFIINSSGIKLRTFDKSITIK